MFAAITTDSIDPIDSKSLTGQILLLMAKKSSQPVDEQVVCPIIYDRF